MDNPTSRESIITFLHESMHAGNPGVVGDDGGYIERKEEFVRAQEADKIANAAHYEVVPRRMLGMGAVGFAYPGVTFTPGVLAPPVGVGVAPPPAPVGAPVVSLKEQAIDAAYLAWKEAWTTALNLHCCSSATTALPPTGPAHPGGVRAAGRRTVHRHPSVLVEGGGPHDPQPSGVNPASVDPSTQPLTQIDVALSEAVVRQLARGMFRCPRPRPRQHARGDRDRRRARRGDDGADRARPADQAGGARIGTVTGNAARDVHVVNTLGPRPLEFTDMLIVRGPGRSRTSACGHQRRLHRQLGSSGQARGSGVPARGSCSNAGAASAAGALSVRWRFLSGNGRAVSEG